MGLFFLIPQDWKAQKWTKLEASRKVARAANLAWLNSSEKIPYAGKWIFLADGKVAASARSRPMVIRLGRQAAGSALSKMVLRIGPDGAVRLPGA